MTIKDEDLTHANLYDLEKRYFAPQRAELSAAIAGDIRTLLAKSQGTLRVLSVGSGDGDFDKQILSHLDPDERTALHVILVEPDKSNLERLAPLFSEESKLGLGAAIVFPGTMEAYLDSDLAYGGSIDYQHYSHSVYGFKQNRDVPIAEEDILSETLVSGARLLTPQGMGLIAVAHKSDYSNIRDQVRKPDGKPDRFGFYPGTSGMIRDLFEQNPRMAPLQPEFSYLDRRPCNIPDVDIEDFMYAFENGGRDDMAATNLAWNITYLLRYASPEEFAADGRMVRAFVDHLSEYGELQSQQQLVRFSQPEAMAA